MSKVLVDRVSPYTPGGFVSVDGILLSGRTYDVTHPDFGGLGNGTADDGPAFKAAYDRAVANGGGIVRALYTPNGYRIGTTINVNGAVPVQFVGPGRLFCTTDVKVFYVTGSKVLFDLLEIDGQQVAVGTNNNLVSLEGCSDVMVHRCRLLNARCDAVHIGGAGTSNIRIVDNYISRPAIHGVLAIDGTTDLLVLGNRIVEPGFNAVSTAAGKGVGVQGNTLLCKDIRIIGNKIDDPNQIAIELFGGSGVAPGVQGATVMGNVIRSTKVANGNRFGISLDATTEAVVNGNSVNGTELAFEIAGGCKRCMYDGNISIGSLGDGVQISNNSGNTANDPDQIIIANTIVKTPTGKGIQATAFKSLKIANPDVDGGADRGLFINNPAAGATFQILGGTVTGCVKTGVYLFIQQYLTGTVRDIQSIGNNTSATAGSEDVGFYVNADTQAHQNSIRFIDIVGSITSSFSLSALKSNFALSATATTSVGLTWRYRKGERWTATYRIPVQVTGGVAGLKFLIGALPAGATARMSFLGTTAAVGTLSTDFNTTVTSANAVAFLTASFTGYVEIVLTLVGGTADGDIDLQVVTGAAAAGTIFQGSAVDLLRT